MYDAQLGGHTHFEDAAASPSHRGGSAALQSAVLADVLDEIDYGLLLLGADGRILFENQLARLELGGERFVRRRQDRFVACSARHGEKIEAALANVQRGRRSLVSLSGADGELALSFIPLNPGARSVAQSSDAPLAMVILGRRNACEALTLHHYGQLHGLTGAEQALLPAIIRGLSVDAIARQQCVSLSTVRTQLGSIREKTGAKSLRALTARLTSLPPIRPSLRDAQIH
ncbi:MAG: helix-turn-helix transcriptional regulator [Burkholderiales bacterium]